MPKIQNIIINICILITLASTLILSGCRGNSPPRLRISEFFGNPWGTRFADPNNLGAHCLHYCHDEKLGLVYTCQGGFIDMGHLREAADRTYCIAQITYKNLMQSKTNYSYHVIEPSRYHITLCYPGHWEGLSKQQKEAAARDISTQAGQYLAHTSLIWHEILTWYGFSSSGLFPETISAFSLEDPYSDVLGTRLAAKILSDRQCFYEDAAYEKAMTTLIDETLKELDVQSVDVTKKTVQTVKGQWYEGGGYFFVKMKKRNFDVGFDDGYVTPWLVPGICPDIVAKDSPVPNPDSTLSKYGFKMQFEIEMKEHEKDSIYKTLEMKSFERIKPPVHFPKIISSIIDEAKKLEGDDVDNNNWPETNGD